jgi:hypothetical protein
MWFLTYFSNKCMIISSFRKKKHCHLKEVLLDFIVEHCILFFFFLLLVMFHEPQTWSPIAVKKCKLHIICTLILSNIFINYWIKISFDSKWTLNSKMLSCKFLKKLSMFRITKGCHQDFSLFTSPIILF